jgi:hypothetical protein
LGSASINGEGGEEFPDLNPIKVNIRYQDFMEEPNLGVLVSKYIGPKVFANYIA